MNVSVEHTDRLLVAGMILAVAGIGVGMMDRAWWGLALGSGFVLAGLVLHSWKRDRFQTRHVVMLALLFRGLLFPIGPSFSDDAYRYIWDGRLQAEGINPYAYKPSDDALRAYQDEPIYHVLNSQDYYTVYPPVSQRVFKVGGWVYGHGWMAGYYAIKWVLVLVEIGGLLLMARLVPARSLILYAWNPVVLIETAGQAHTEGLLVTGFVVMLWAWRHRFRRVAVAALTVAAWVKLYPLVLLPLLLRRVGVMKAWVAGAVSLIVIWPYYHPEALEHVGASLDLYVRLFEFNAGPYYLLKALLTEWSGRTGWSKVIGPQFRTLFLLSLPVLYYLDWKYRWSLPRAVTITLGLFFVLATTLHPWYFLGLLVMVPFLERPAWNWLWLTLALEGTYLFYTIGWYWSFIWVGWIGWLVLSLAVRRTRRALVTVPDRWLRWVQRLRARRKVTVLAPHVPEEQYLEVLDLGCGEGFVGEAFQARFAARVVLADVLPMNRTALPYVLYDGRRLPFDDRSFDITVLYFVLHHSEDPKQVVAEALRVTRGRVLIVESTFDTEQEYRRLAVLDSLANRIRSGGLMIGQEDQVRFLRVEQWQALLGSGAGRVVHLERWGQWLHKQVLFVLEPEPDREG